MVVLIRAGFPLGFLRQPKERECGSPRPLDHRRVHPVIPDVEEADLARGSVEFGPDPGGVGTIPQRSDIDYGNFTGVGRFNSRENVCGHIFEFHFQRR